MHELAFLNVKIHLPFDCPVAKNIQVILYRPTVYTFVPPQTNTPTDRNNYNILHR